MAPLSRGLIYFAFVPPSSSTNTHVAPLSRGLIYLASRSFHSSPTNPTADCAVASSCLVVSCTSCLQALVALLPPALHLALHVVCRGWQLQRPNSEHGE